MPQSASRLSSTATIAAPCRFLAAHQAAGILLLGAVVSLAISAAAWAADPPAAAAPTAANPAAPAAAEDPARAAILESSTWQETLGSFQFWLEHQSIYDAEQVDYIRKQLALRIKKASANDLKAMQIDLQAKLGVLMSTEMSKTEAVFEEYREVLAPKKVTELQRKLPNVLDLSATELRTRIIKFQDRQGARAEAQSSFNQMQTQIARDSVAAQRAQAAAAQRAREQSLAASARAANTGTNSRSQFTPKPYRKPDRGPTFSVGPLGGVRVYYGSQW